MSLQMLLTLIAGVTSASLAVLSFSSPRRRSRSIGYFGMLATSLALWALGLLAIEVMGESASTLQVGLKDPVYYLGAVMMLGASAAPSAWILFCASYTDHDEWLSGWRLALVVAPFAITLLSGLTNPWHGLMLAPDAPSDSLGILALPMVVAAVTFGPLGAIWLARSMSQRHVRGSRMRSRLIAVVAIIPIAGAILWIAAPDGHVIFETDPSPMLFSFLTLALAFEVFTSGFADIVPAAQREVVAVTAEAIIAVNTQTIVTEANPAAIEMVSGLDIGVRLSDVSPALAEHVNYCLTYAVEELSFEMIVGDRTVWGRVRHEVAEGFEGCMILLTDLTDLHSKQDRLHTMGRTAEGKMATSEYLDRVPIQGAPR